VAGLAFLVQALALGQVRRGDQCRIIDRRFLVAAFGIPGGALDLDGEGQRFIVVPAAADEYQIREKAEQQKEQHRSDDRARIHVEIMRIHVSCPLDQPGPDRFPDRPRTFCASLAPSRALCQDV
jgi:hypothetical protein